MSKSSNSYRSRFQATSKLGKGAFGGVFEVLDKHDNTVKALKMVRDLETLVL